MSLIKQLWLAVIILITLAFISSFAISSYSARGYFAEQLRVKNIDNANVLAMSLSQLEKDPVLIELMIAAQFDTGHYQRIELIKPDGETFLKKEYEPEAGSSVPHWFRSLTPLEVEPGVAQVQDNWHQFGTLYIESHSRFAHQALWQSTCNLLFWFTVVAVLCGMAGSLILKMITRPLDNVVAQAEAIGGRRFITSDEPKTLEFGRVVRAMNILSGRVRQMLEAESQRLEEMRHKYQHDQLTGLANREYFLSTLDATLHAEDKAAQHALFLIRAVDLKQINQQLGHHKTDQLLRYVADICRDVCERFAGKYAQATAGRLNGSDFAVLFTETDNITALSNAFQVQLNLLNDEYRSQVRLCFPQAATYFHSDESRATILMRLDSLLASAEQREETCSEVCTEIKEVTLFRTAEEWRTALLQAMQQSSLQLQYFPVQQTDGALLHKEAMARLPLAGELRTAGYFIAWARRLGVLPLLDLAVAERVLNELQSSGERIAVAINLSVELLKDSQARTKLLALLHKHAASAEQVWLEFTEQAVASEILLFKEFSQSIKDIGCKLGLQAAGNHFAQIADVQELGLDYLKLDGALIRQLSVYEQDAQAFVRGLCSLGHSLGLLMIAEGVTAEADIALLKQLGLDAVTGPGVKPLDNATQPD